MKKYYAINISETLSRTVIIEANNLEKALKIAEDCVDSGRIELEFWDDSEGFDFQPDKEFDDDGEVKDLDMLNHYQVFSEEHV